MAVFAIMVAIAGCATVSEGDAVTYQKSYFVEGFTFPFVFDKKM